MFYPTGSYRYVLCVSALDLHEVVLYGVDNEVSGVFAARLLKDVGAVLIHRAL